MIHHREEIIERQLGLDGARAAAVQQLGPSATKADLAAKETEIKTAKYTEIETLMAKDSAAKPDAAVLWAQLGLAQSGLKKYDDAETSFKKALQVDTDSKKPNPPVEGMAMRDSAAKLTAAKKQPRGDR